MSKHSNRVIDRWRAHFQEKAERRGFNRIPRHCSWLLWASLLFAMSAAAQAQSGSCKNRILFLPQIHEPINGQWTPSMVDEVWRSQFQIVKFIEKNSKVPVFTELRPERMTIRGQVSAKGQRTIKEHREVFGKNFPATFDEMNRAQLDKLLSSHADLVALAMGIIQDLYSTVPEPGIQLRIIEKMKDYWRKNPYQPPPKGSEIYRLTYDYREALALTEISKFFRKNPQHRDVILIYGGLHDFRRHSDLFPPQCILIPDEFSTVLASGRKNHLKVDPAFTNLGVPR